MLELVGAILIGGVSIITPFIQHLNEGKYCVNATVQAGDLIQISNGSIMQVTVIEGPSMLCKNPETPIKAQAETLEQKHQR